MTEASRPRDREGFETAIICALQKEADAVEASFDKFWDDDGDTYGKAPRDTNSYTMGVIGRHNVVLAFMPGMGKGSAAGVAAGIRSSFGGIKLALVVGICAGVPNHTDDDHQILLGDVVISKGVVQYDFGRQMDGGFRRKIDMEESLGRPNLEFRSLLPKLQTARRRERLQDNTFHYLTGIIRKTKAQYPGAMEDKLYKSTYRHVHRGTSTCTICANCEEDDTSACDDALNASCAQLECDETMLVRRGRLDRAMDGFHSGEGVKQKPVIHYGLVASGDTVMKSGKERDKVAAKAKAIAFEMEGAGVWDILPCVVIKGVCDYGDSHKNKVWQRYAAATAAACAKAFLSEWTPTSQTTQTQSSVKGHWLVPFGRNEHFVGRDSHIQKVMTKLHPQTYNDDCQRVAIAGLGGVGKTQIALEAAFRFREMYPDQSVFWVPAIDVTNFERAYREIGNLLGLPGINDNKADVKSLVKAALSRESTGSWLLVIDNADDINLLYNKSNKDSETGIVLALADYLPFSLKGSLLLTTRNSKVAFKHAGVNVIKVEEMTEDDARQLLEKSLVDARLRGGDDVTSRLLGLLTHLPLAIKQAAAYMSENGTHVSKYLEICESEELPELLNTDFEDQGRYREGKNPIAMTWLVSFNQIRERDALAEEYLYFMSCYAQQDVPNILLPSGSSAKQEQEALGTLKAYALITLREGQDSYYIHRLVRLAVRNWLKKQKELHVCFRKTLKHIADVFPSPEHKNRDLWTTYLPHALCILDYQDYSGDDEVHERLLLFYVGSCFTLVGKYAEAEQTFQQALKLTMKGLGKKHPDTLHTMNNLARVLKRQGRYGEAENMHQKTLKLQEEVLGKKHPDTLRSMNSLAIVLESQSRYGEAENMHQKTLKLQEEVLGKKHPDTLASMNNLAIMLKSQGRYGEAENMHQKTLKLKEEVLGKKHPDTLLSMNNLALVLQSQGRYGEAENMHQKTLKLQEEVLGKKHPETLDTMNNLALVLESQSRYGEAEDMHQKTLKLREEVLGKTHPETLDTMNNLARVLESQSRYGEAEDMHQKTLKLREEVLGKKHPETLDTMNNLALVLESQSRYGEAEDMHQKTLKLREEVLGKKHPETLDTMNNLALVLESQSRYGEAEDMHQKTLKLREEVLGKKHPDTLDTMNNLAVVLGSQEKYEEAERLREQTLQLEEEVLGKEHPYTLTSRADLASLRQRIAERLEKEGESEISNSRPQLLNEANHKMVETENISAVKNAKSSSARKHPPPNASAAGLRRSKRLKHN